MSGIEVIVEDLATRDNNLSNGELGRIELKGKGGHEGNLSMSRLWRNKDRNSEDCGRRTGRCSHKD